jgi:hypothetical protein
VDAAPARHGKVWIAEDLDRQEPLLLTGRFSGYLDRDEQLTDTFEDLKAEDGIAWGRARASTDLIRTGDSSRYFSAGEHNLDPQEFPAWPPAGLRLEPSVLAASRAWTTPKATRQFFGMFASRLIFTTRYSPPWRVA